MDTRSGRAHRDTARGEACPPVSVAVDDGVATVTLDDPQRLNALSPAACHALLELLPALAVDDSVRVVAFAGAGGNFSAGAALDQVTEVLFAPADAAPATRDLLTEVDLAVGALPVPTVALVRGICMGGAWQFASAADIVLAADDARLAVTPANLGLLLPLRGVRRLAARVGVDRAKYLLFTGEEIPAALAAEWGLVTRVVPSAEFDDAAVTLLRRLATRSAYSQAAFGAAFDAIEAEAGLGPGASAAAADAVGAAYAPWWDGLPSSEDLAIGRAAFAEKRRPEFTWRRRVE